MLPQVVTALESLSVDGGTFVSTAIVPHEQWVPSGATLPFVGVRNGGTANEDCTCAVSSVGCLVNLVASVRMNDEDNEAAIVGAGGTLAILDAATAAVSSASAAFTGIQAFEVIKDHPDNIIKTENGQWIVQSVRSLLITVERSTL
ncbi:MAG: hypothetical protein EOL92_00460 [Bacteroidia bacterium]|nr:hypothetical protein [Bacteroidia bacterium]